MLQNFDLLLYTLLGSLTIISSSLVAITFVSSEQLRQHPSGLIMSIAICEVIMSYHSIIFAWGSKNYVNYFTLDLSIILFSDHERSLLIICGLNQIILTAATVGCICYNTAICVDLVLTLYNPLIPGRVRRIWYHLIIGITVIYFTVYLNIYSDFVHDCDSNENNRLEIINTGSVGILLSIYLSFALVSVFYSIYRFANGLKQETSKTKEYLIRHILYVFVFIICWFCPAISYLLKSCFDINEYHEDIIDTIAIGTTSSSGFLLGLVRISEPIVRQKIVDLVRRQKEERNSPCDAWTQPVAVIVQSQLNNELAKFILKGLHLTYLRLKESEIEPDEVERKEFLKKSSLSFNIEEKEMSVWGVNDEKLKGIKIDFYACEVFLGIIQKSGMRIYEITESLAPENNKNNEVDPSQGKSGSFFLHTCDGKFIVKTIKRSERKIMLKFLKDYYNHLAQFPNTLLCKIYGLFSINIPGVTVLDFMLMESIFKDLIPIKIYDIKGSTYGRTSRKKGEEPRVALKDLDFIEMKDRLYLSDEDTEKLRFQILKDVVVLKKNKLMDYSMLIGTSRLYSNSTRIPMNSFLSVKNGIVYTIGIIDFLTEYGKLKSLEHNWASLTRGKQKIKQVSVANPTRYANRFYNFVFSVVVPIIKRNSSFVLSDE